MRMGDISAGVAHGVNRRAPSSWGRNNDRVRAAEPGQRPPRPGHPVIAAAGVYGAGIAVYLRLTPFHELDLVRGGNVAAAITLSGALIGLAIPIGMTLAHSLNVADILIWGSVSAALQAIAFGAPVSRCAGSRRRSSAGTSPPPWWGRDASLRGHHQRGRDGHVTPVPR